MASGARLLIIFCVLGIFIDFFSNLYSLFSMKIIFVTGGIISGLGKGVTASSIGRLLKSSGYSINMMKIDPYLQVDAGTMSPYEHGEVFVTEDGAETDLDVGNYERFVDIELNKESNPTTGKIYLTVIENERRGDYLGKTVQVIPHITDDIKRRITGQAAKADICIVEIGGLVGDAESPVFIEAIRQIRKDIGKENVCYVHVVPLLYIDVSGEFKTKAIQLSTRQLREAGIQPDILVSRCPKPMPPGIEAKNLDVYGCWWIKYYRSRRCSNYLRSSAPFPETRSQGNYRGHTSSRTSCNWPHRLAEIRRQYRLSRKRNPHRHRREICRARRRLHECPWSARPCWCWNMRQKFVVTGSMPKR
jgi:hypothetical protein